MSFYKKYGNAAPKKTIGCLNCGASQGNLKNKYCVYCRSEEIYLFDSKTEAERYQYLKAQKHIKNIIIQPKFDLVTSVLDYQDSVCDGKYSAPKFYYNDKKKYKIVKWAEYTGDFQYFDKKNNGQHVIEDVKPYNYKTKKPIISQDVQMRLNNLYVQCGHKFKIITVAYAGKGFYVEKEVKPTIKNFKKNKKSEIGMLFPW